MRRLWLTIFILTVARPCAAENFPTLDFFGLIDLRAVQTDDQFGAFDGGQGKTRYGGKLGQGDRFIGRVGEASLILLSHLTWGVDGFLHLKYDPDQELPLDIVEGFARIRPVSTDAVQFSFKIGSFFPPVSLENVGTAWQSPYTLSWSAANTWIGQETRANGLEVSATRRFEDGGLTFGGAFFMANDPTGIVLAERGWALHDRATALFDEFDRPIVAANLSSRGSIKPFKEIDSRPGVYLFSRFVDEYIGVEALVTLYDNLADSAATRDGHGAWRTRFAAAGVQYDLPWRTSVLTQVMVGDTERVPSPTAHIDVDFATVYAMLTHVLDDGEKHRISLRYDWFKNDDNKPLPGVRQSFDEHGDAWTLAYNYTPDDHHRVTLEILSVDSHRPGRAGIGEKVDVRDTTIQASYRYEF